MNRLKASNADIGPIKYKPALMDYMAARMRVIKRLGNKHKGLSNEAVIHDHEEDVRKPIFLAIKALGMVSSDYFDDKEGASSIHKDASSTLFFIGLLTPRQFMKIFPIDKTYDEKRYGAKDYFFTVDAINKIGLNNIIGRKKVTEFLMHYSSWDVKHFIATYLMASNQMRVLQGDKNVIEEWFEQKVPQHTPATSS